MPIPKEESGLRTGYADSFTSEAPSGWSVPQHTRQTIFSPFDISAPLSRRRRTLCWLVPVAVLVLLFVILIAYLTLSQNDQSSSLSSASCLYALGGGIVSRKCAWPDPPPECRKPLKKYMETQYEADMHVATTSAWNWVKSVGNQSDTQLVVFDIDETTLSNTEMLTRELKGETVNDTVWREWVLKAEAPAISAVKDLYLELYRKGFTVTFITGRDELDGAREATSANLKAAGFGEPCWHRQQEVPCYLQLDMRGANDTDKVASVYKPERRALLKARGYSIVASFGDQWSDLAGSDPAAVAFKLPNPFYYIL